MSKDAFSKLEILLLSMISDKPTHSQRMRVKEAISDLRNLEATQNEAILQLQEIRIDDYKRDDE